MCCACIFQRDNLQDRVKEIPEGSNRKSTAQIFWMSEVIIKFFFDFFNNSVKVCANSKCIERMSILLFRTIFRIHLRIAHAM